LNLPGTGALIARAPVLNMLSFGLRLSVVACIALILSSCSREPDIKRPFDITVGFGADAKRLLPLLASDSASGDISGHIFNGLTKYDKDIKITGDLAESWR